MIKFATGDLDFILYIEQVKVIVSGDEREACTGYLLIIQNSKVDVITLAAACSMMLT